jgi:hypothetical protein
MPPKSSRSVRKTVVLTTRSSPEPASSRIAWRLSKIFSVCCWIESPTISAWSGSSESWPETKTKPFARIACE